MDRIGKANTTHELRFGVVFQPNVPWEEIVRRFLYLEKLDIDIAGTVDHFVSFRNPSIPWLELWTLTSAWAARTNRIRVGMWVTAFLFRNPAFLARQALTVDHISNGRLEVGLGTGITDDPSYEMTGIPNWSPRERVARFREYVEIVDQLLRNEVTTYDGRYYKINGAVMNPRPIQKPRPPITIAAHRPRMLKLATRHADTWNTLGKAEDLDEIRHRNQLVDKYCRDIGRDSRSLRRSFWFYYPEVRKRGGFYVYYESEDSFRETVRPYIELGMSEILLSYPTREEHLPMFEKIACEVIPDLKEKYSK